MRELAITAGHKLTVLMVAVLLFAYPRAAPAQESRDQIRLVARDLGYAGVAALEAGDTGTAIEKLSRAYSLLSVPTLALWLARAYEKQGRLVEAAERYLEATRIVVPTNAPEGQREAQLTAASERAALIPRIPKLLINVRGAPPDEVQVTVNGLVLDHELIGIGAPFNPGETSVVGVYRRDQVAMAATLSEGQLVEVTLNFAQAPGDSQLPHESQSPRANPPPEPQPRDAERPDLVLANDQERSRLPVYVALGAAGTGLVVGTLAGALAWSKHSELNDACSDGCPPEYHDENQRYETMKNVSTGGFLVGLVGAGIGAVLLLTEVGDANETVGRSRSSTGWSSAHASWTF